MGVKSLWSLLSPVGRRISIETLERKTLAIDISIWLVQFVKAMRDDDGKMLPHAHLTGCFRRIAKLLFHRIRPVFVFDGGVPILKQRTIQARRQRRQFNELGHQALAKKVFMTQLKKHALAQRTSEAEEGSGFADGFHPGAQAQAHTATGTRAEKHAETQANAPAKAAATAVGSAPPPEADLSDDDESSIEWEAGDTRGQGATADSTDDDEWEHVGAGHGPIEEVSEEWLAGLDVDSRKRVIKERLFNHERQKAGQLEQVRLIGGTAVGLTISASLPLAADS